jgi:hypothetical protein
MRTTNIGALLLRYYPFLFFCALLALTLYPRHHFRSLNGIIWSDAEGYYMYLPAVFIYGGFEGVPIRTIEQFGYYPGTEKVFTKYTYGVALLQAPFFLIFHGAALLRGQEADGYSDYYKYSIMLAGVFYAFLGVYFLRGALLRHFSPGVAFLSSACLIFGTNALFYIIGEPGVSHIYSFFLFALMMYLTPRFHARMDWETTALLGLVCGLIVLIRPTNIVALLYLLLYEVRSWGDFRARLSAQARRWRVLWLFPFCAALVFLPQFCYWKYISGSFLIYSYGEEGFPYLASPRIFPILFGVVNGWLLFSPILFVALSGLYHGVARGRHNMPVIALIVGLTLYLCASWWMWWFGGGFGYRPMVEYLALLAIPFACQARACWRGKRWRRVAFALLLGVLTYYSLQLTRFKDGPNYNWYTWKVAVDRMTPFVNIFYPGR